MASHIAGIGILIVLVTLVETEKITVQREGKCKKGDTRQVYPNCMFDEKAKTLWCDQSNYKKLPSVNEINAHLYDVDCTTAKALYVNDSCLQQIANNDLQPYKSIRSFLGGQNYIKILNSSTFVENKELADIDLCDNDIRHLDWSTYAGLRNLRKLHLNNNKITKVSGATSGNWGLEILSMKHNLLIKIGHHSFQHLLKLRILNLQGNTIAVIGNHSFRGMSSLTHLHLDGNHLEKITPHTFRGLQGLEILTLSHNQIKYWPAEYGVTFTNVHTLHLGSNQLDKFTPLHVANMSKLQNLALDNNSISRISEGLFLSTPRLTYLNLSKNYLEDIPENIFKTQCHLESLILKRNRLRGPKAAWFDHVVQKNITKTHTSISENLWRCDCNIVKFQKFLEALEYYENATARILAQRLQITCSAPKFAKGHVLDKPLAEEIQFRLDCPVVPAESSESISTAATPRTCDYTESFKRNEFDVTSQYSPQNPLNPPETQPALLAKQQQRRIGKTSFSKQDVETSGSNALAVVPSFPLLFLSLLCLLYTTDWAVTDQNRG